MARYLDSTSRERTPPGVHFLVKVYSVAANTFLEGVRQPVFAVILGGATALILVSPYITMFTLNNSPRLIKDMGLATIMLAGMLMAAFSASKVVSEEIENRTVLGVISKPVGRMEFILGKFLGVISGLLVGVYLLSLAFVLTVTGGALEADIEQELNLWVVLAVFGSMFMAVCYGVYSNFFNDRPFPSRALGAAVPLFTISFLVFVLVDPREFPKGPFVDIRMVYACVMVLCSILVLASVAVAISTRLSVVVNVSLCSGVFVLGLLSDYLFGRFESSVMAAKVLYRLIPNFQVFWMTELIAANVPLPLGHMVWSGVYAACHLAAFLFLAMILFEQRQVS